MDIDFCKKWKYIFKKFIQFDLFLQQLSIGKVIVHMVKSFISPRFIDFLNTAGSFIFNGMFVPYDPVL